MARSETETVLTENVGYLAGPKLQWNVETPKATNFPGADQLIRRENRKGWTL
jgi:hypothetical protein